MARWFRAAMIGSVLLAQPAYAADIAVDIATGMILTATEADALRRPASLAKLMTAYVAFEALASDEVAEGERVPVSAFAARTPPVKLRMRAGSKIEFAEALGAAVVGSKNDAAVVVAEAIAGSEEAFVERMNVTASHLGMSNTRFANATGLPAPGQQTTARDMALLSRAMLTQFPQRSKLLSRRSVTALGRRVSTTNPLFGRVKGAEGLKTGFTCAAGYSVAALVERSGRRIIAVTLGHPSKNSRLREARGLIEAAFKIADGGDALTPAKAKAGLPPDIGACSGAATQLIATDISPEEKALYAAEVAKARQRAAGEPNLPRPSIARVLSKKEPPKPLAPPPLSGWSVFIGAHISEQAAETRLQAAHRLLRQRGTIRVERRVRDGRFLALIYGLDQRIAVNFCKSVSTYCLTLTPARLLNARAQWRR